MLKEEKEKSFDKIIKLILEKIKENKNLSLSNVLYIPDES